MSTITQADGRRKRVNSGAEDRMVGSAGRTGWQDGQDGRMDRMGGEGMKLKIWNSIAVNCALPSTAVRLGWAPFVSCVHE